MRIRPIEKESEQGVDGTLLARRLEGPFAPVQKQYSTNVENCQLGHGRIEGDTWHKTAKGSLHRLRRPPAWAVDLADLEAAEALGVRLVAIYDQEAERDYWASIGIIRRRGFVLNRNFGEQVALPLAWWRSTRQEAEALEGESKEGEQPASPQLSLGLLS